MRKPTTRGRQQDRTVVYKGLFVGLGGDPPDRRPRLVAKEAAGGLDDLAVGSWGRD